MTTPSTGKQQARLVDAAQQFEGMLLQEMLKPMQKSADPWEAEDGKSEDSSGGTMMSYGTEALATSISKAGGLGIAQQVLRQIGVEDAQKKGNRQY